MSALNKTDSTRKKQVTNVPAHWSKTMVAFPKKCYSKIRQRASRRWLPFGSAEAFTRAAVQLARNTTRVRFFRGSRTHPPPSPLVGSETTLNESDASLLYATSASAYHSISRNFYITCTDASTSMLATNRCTKKKTRAVVSTASQIGGRAVSITRVSPVNVNDGRSFAVAHRR